MKKILLGLIRAYRFMISPFLGNHCRFEPSCSRYAEEALEKKGISLGLWLALTRLLRCHPWSSGGLDPLEQ